MLAGLYDKLFFLAQPQLNVIQVFDHWTKEDCVYCVQRELERRENPQLPCQRRSTTVLKETLTCATLVLP